MHTMGERGRQTYFTTWLSIGNMNKNRNSFLLEFRNSFSGITYGSVDTNFVISVGDLLPGAVSLKMLAIITKLRTSFINRLHCALQLSNRHTIHSPWFHSVMFTPVIGILRASPLHFCGAKFASYRLMTID